MRNHSAKSQKDELQKEYVEFFEKFLDFLATYGGNEARRELIYQEWHAACPSQWKEQFESHAAVAVTLSANPRKAPQNIRSSLRLIFRNLRQVSDARDAKEE